MLNEKFLSYVWQFGLFEHRDLRTTLGEPIVINKVGNRNTQEGPDFFNAQVQIADTTWAGNIEIHVKASDWLKHQHQTNKAYQNVVLHVVWEADTSITNQQGQLIACLALDGKVNPNVWHNYQQIMYNSNPIPCAQLLPKIDPLTLSFAIDQLLIARLEQKTKPISEILAQNNYAWEQTFYRLLARTMGSKANSQAMEQVAQSININILAKHKQQLIQIEALLIGQAGLLSNEYLSQNNQTIDPYINTLQKEYEHLSKMYQLKSLPSHIWKFGGLRPPNFPTIRLAQLAALIHQSSHLFSKIIETEQPQALLALFKTEASEYWDKHYTFGKKNSKSNPKSIGDSTLQLIIINAVVPILFLYAKERAQPELQERALQLLSQIAPEKNSIIDHWENLNMPIKTAFETQAFLQLYNEYCTPKKCLECSIGNRLLRG